LPPLYSPLTSPCSLFLSSYAAPRDLHSFPTRRSSDLIGVSARLAKTALAQMSGVELQDIEEIWHGIASPYEPLFAWLEGKAEKPAIHHAARFHPLMLSNPIDEARDFAELDPADFAAEWKWDGIRIQLILGPHGVSLFSRTGDDIAPAFPDLGGAAFGHGV